MIGVENNANAVSLKRLAAMLQMDRSSCRRWILRQGVKPVQKRTGDSNYQWALTVTPNQAAELRRIRVADGYLNAPVTIASAGLSNFSDSELIEELRRRLSKKISEGSE